MLCHYVECRYLFIIMLHVITLSAAILNVVMLNDMMSVVAPVALPKNIRGRIHNTSFSS